MTDLGLTSFLASNAKSEQTYQRLLFGITRKLISTLIVFATNTTRLYGFK